MLLVIEVLVVAAIVFVVAALAVGRFDRMEPAPPDGSPRNGRLPDGPLTPDALGGVRFGMAARGYRMSEVDDMMALLAVELAYRDAEIMRLGGYGAYDRAETPPDGVAGPDEGAFAPLDGDTRG